MQVHKSKFILILIFITGMTLVSPFDGLCQSSTSKSKADHVKTGYYSNSNFQLSELPGLSDYEKVLLLSNLRVKSVYAEWQMEISRITLAKGLPDPKINFGYFIENVETAVGPQEYKIGIMQIFPWPGKLIVQGDIQSAKADAIYQKMRNTIENQLLGLRIVYFDAFLLERTIDITKQNLDLVRNWEQVILSKYKTDLARHADLIKTQIESIKLQDDLTSLELKRTPLLERMRSLLNIPDLSQIHFPDSLIYDVPVIDEDMIKQIVLKNNPEINRLTVLQDISQKNIVRAKLNYLPDFSLGIDLIETGEKYNSAGAAVAESGKNPVVFMGSLTIPLWLNKQAAGVRAANYGRKAAVLNLQAKVNTTKTELEQILFILKDNERRVQLYRDILIPKSIESLRSTEKAYIGNAMEFINLIDAQRRYLQFQLSFEKSQINYEKAKAKLAALTGRKL